MSLFTNEVAQLAYGSTAGGFKIQNVEPLNIPVSATSTSQTVFIVPNYYVSGGSAFSPTYKIVEVNVVFGTASSSGTLQVEHLTGTQASGGGTAILSSTISLSATANTVYQGTISSSLTAAQATFSPGDRIGIVLGGTLTSLANCYIQVVVAIQ